LIFWVSSLNTRQFRMLSGIEGLKSLSTEKPSLGGINLDILLANISVSIFWLQGIEVILNVLKEKSRFHTSCWYHFRCGDRQWMVFLTYRMIIFESMNYLTYFTLSSMAFFRTWTKASYSIVLLVHSNSRQHDMNILPCSGLINTHPAPTPSYDLEP
jgi:hypothetical protein